MQALTVDDLSEMLGVAAPAITRHVASEALADLQWRRLAQDERDNVLLDAWRKIESGTLVAAGPDGLARWEKGWGEVLERVNSQGAREETLRPQYFYYDVIRLRDDYARVAKQDFEFRLYRILADLIFRQYLSGLDSIVEFACGTGLNLLHLGRLFPGIKLTGCDWAHPSQAILARIAADHNLDLVGRRVDLWTGAGFDAAALTRGRTGIITMHGLEQIGSEIGRFLDMVAAIRPAVVLHVEPLVELYDPERLFDAVAINYHTKRRYLAGLLPAVRALRDQGKADILAERRLGLGSAFHEGYSLLAWRPR